MHLFIFFLHVSLINNGSHRLLYQKLHIIVFLSRKSGMFDECSLRFLLHDNDFYVIGISMRDMLFKIFDVWSYLKIMIRVKYFVYVIGKYFKFF